MSGQRNRRHGAEDVARCLEAAQEMVGRFTGGLAGLKKSLMDYRTPRLEGEKP